MSRRRRIDGGKTAKKAKSDKPKRSPPPKASAPVGKIALLLVIVVLIVIAAYTFNAGDEDGKDKDNVPNPPKPEPEIVHNFTLEAPPKSVNIVASTNMTLNLTLNNTGNVTDLFVISNASANEVDVTGPGNMTLEAGEVVFLMFNLEPNVDNGTYFVILKVSINGTNITEEHSIIVIVSNYGLRFKPLTKRLASPTNKSVVFLFEVSNTGTLWERITLTTTSFDVKNGDKTADGWTAPRWDIGDKDIELFPNTQNTSHVRLTIDVPSQADPRAEQVAEISIEARSETAWVMDGIEVVVNRTIRIAVLDLEVEATVDAKAKEVLQDEWVYFDVSFLNAGGTPLDVKYRITQDVPNGWEWDFPANPQSGWNLTVNEPVNLQIGVKPTDKVPNGSAYPFGIQVFGIDVDVQHQIDVIVTVAQARFDVLTRSQIVFMDLEELPLEVEFVVVNSSPFDLDIDLSETLPKDWTGNLDTYLVSLGPEGNQTVNLSLWAPNNTLPATYDVLFIGESDGILVDLDLKVVVNRTGEGELELISEGVLTLPRPINETRLGEIDLNLTNTGNDITHYVIELNWSSNETFNWTLHLNHGSVEDNETIDFELASGEWKNFRLNVTVSPENNPDAINCLVRVYIEENGLEQIAEIELIAEIQQGT